MTHFITAENDTSPIVLPLKLRVKWFLMYGPPHCSIFPNQYRKEAATGLGTLRSSSALTVCCKSVTHLACATLLHKMVRSRSAWAYLHLLAIFVMFRSIMWNAHNKWVAFGTAAWTVSVEMASSVNIVLHTCTDSGHISTILRSTHSTAALPAAHTHPYENTSCFPSWLISAGAKNGKLWRFVPLALLSTNHTWPHFFRAARWRGVMYTQPASCFVASSINSLYSNPGTSAFSFCNIYIILTPS